MKAARATITTFCIIMGLAGIEHGIGEILQGSVAPDGIIFRSWPEADFFRVVNGEPAMTIVPNLFVTGMLALIFSVVYILWAIFFVERKNASFILFFIAFAMLLFGGGIFPPIIGMFLGIIAGKVNEISHSFRDRLSPTSLRFFMIAWPWTYAASILAWLTLCPGLNLLAFYFGVDNTELTVIVILLALIGLVFSIITGFGYSAYKQIEAGSA